MKNETVTLSRELANRIAKPIRKPTDETTRRVAIRELRAALAEPVPPAGGDVEVLGYSVKGNRYAIRLTKGELLELCEIYTGDALIELVDRAHVTRLQERLEEYEAENLAVRAATQEKDYSIARLQAELREKDDENTRLLNEASRLQAEVERLRSDNKNYDRLLVRSGLQRHALQSELTKARELLTEWLNSNFTGSCPARNDLRCRTDYALALGQSAPAAKDLDPIYMTGATSEGSGQGLVADQKFIDSLTWGPNPAVRVADETGVKGVAADWCESCDAVTPHETRCVQCSLMPAPVAVVLPDITELREYHAKAFKDLEHYADDSGLRESDVKHYRKRAEFHARQVALIDSLSPIKP